METELIARGAEAEVREGKYLGREAVFKKRIPKKYRVAALDSRIRKERTRSEARLLHKAKQAGVRTPVLYHIDLKNDLLVLEKIPGKSLKQKLGKTPNPVMGKVGEMVARLHQAGIIHGDLTTSNIIVETGRIAFIDFGLGFESNKREDQSVDILNFKKTYAATHYELPQGWDAFVKQYCAHFKKGLSIIKHIDTIEARARYS